MEERIKAVMPRLKQLGCECVCELCFFRILNLARFYHECWRRSFPLLIAINHWRRKGHVRTLSQDDDSFLLQQKVEVVWLAFCFFYPAVFIA